MQSDTLERVSVATGAETSATQVDEAGKPEPRRWRAEAPFVLALLLAYLLPVLIVPPTTNVPLIDDWNHALSVQRLVETGNLRVSDWTATTLVFQIVWGGLFAALFGFSFAILRASTLVMSLIGSLALYALCRLLGITRPRALAGALIFWANPITFGLSYTFMSDLPAVSLQILATLAYVHGVQRGRERSLVIGSVFAALAFLVRHTGILLPMAVLCFGILAGWPRGVYLRRAVASAALPILAVAGYGAWSLQRGLPNTQASFIETFVTSGPSVWPRTALLTLYLLVYAGACLLPLALACGRDGLREALSEQRRLLICWSVMTVALVFGLVVLGHLTSAYTTWMPYLQHGAMVQVSGIGPDNLRGDRPIVLTVLIRVILTALAAASLVIVGVLTARWLRLSQLRHRHWGAAGLVALIALFQVAGVFAVSANVLQGSWLSFDRYFLPVLPPLIVLCLLAVRDIRVSPGLLGAGLSVFMLFSLAGTHDWLVFNQRRWDLAGELVGQGIARNQIDAGMEWDGWFLYEPSLACCPEPRSPLDPDRPFWTEVIAQATDSTWVISSSPQRGYLIREKHTYATWLSRDPSALYVLERSPNGAGPRYP